MASDKAHGIDFQDDLRSSFTGASLPIEPIHIEPKEYLAIDQRVPFNRCHADQALSQCRSRQRLLVAQVHAGRQLRVFEALATLEPGPSFPAQAGPVEKLCRAQQAVPTDRRPICSFSQMVDVCRKLQVGTHLPLCFAITLIGGSQRVETVQET